MSFVFHLKFSALFSKRSFLEILVVSLFLVFCLPIGLDRLKSLTYTLVAYYYNTYLTKIQNRIFKQPPKGLTNNYINSQNFSHEWILLITPLINFPTPANKFTKIIDHIREKIDERGPRDEIVFCKKNFKPKYNLWIQY